MTTWPENGSFWNMKSKALESFSGGTCQATSAPRARFVAMRVWRTRRIVPARSIAAMRSRTVLLVEICLDCNLADRIGLEALQFILGDGENACVDWIVGGDGDGICGHASDSNRGHRKFEFRSSNPLGEARIPKLEFRSSNPRNKSKCRSSNVETASASVPGFVSSLFIRASDFIRGFELRHSSFDRTLNPLTNPQRGVLRLEARRIDW